MNWQAFVNNHCIWSVMIVEPILLLLMFSTKSSSCSILFWPIAIDSKSIWSKQTKEGFSKCNKTWSSEPVLNSRISKPRSEWTLQADELTSELKIFHSALRILRDREFVNQSVPSTCCEVLESLTVKTNVLESLRYFTISLQLVLD